MLDGWVKVYRATPSGEEAVFGVFARGETFAEAALFLGGTYPASAEVVEDARLLRLQTPDRPSGTDFLQRHVHAGARRGRDLNRPIGGVETAPLDLDGGAGDFGAKVLLLQRRLLHQPMGEAPQNLGLRAATFEAPRPQPDMVAHELRHAALVDAVEDQQRARADTGHHRRTAG